ncbi:hypothetical protein Taro_023716 [Colocasia esculenta]|uniref:Uncharacterized protein n=1 Tax=Colocasia esculenta TaxID=4460 RepID=A0A843VI58_COLES|nr:hypothetical protein [Colocasia esculenta]
MSRGTVRGGGGRTGGDPPPPPGARRPPPPHMGSTPPEKNEKTLWSSATRTSPTLLSVTLGSEATSHLPMRGTVVWRPSATIPRPMGKRVYPKICKAVKKNGQSGS